MCTACDGQREVEKQFLCDLYGVDEEIPGEEETETLVALIPDNHPLNQIEPLQQQVGALEERLTRIELKIDELARMIKKIGQLTASIVNVIGAAQRTPPPKIIVPGRD